MTSMRGGVTLRAVLLEAGDPNRESCERELLARGVPLALNHRAVWQLVEPNVTTWFLAVRQGDGTCRYGVGIQVRRSRALPTHLLLRVERLDPSIDPEGCDEALRGLAAAARRRWPRVLRVNVELFSIDAAARARAAECMKGLGFRRVEHARMYRQTAIIDLAGSEEDIFARLRRRARRSVRLDAVSAVEIRPIGDPALIGRVDALAREAFARTGGHYTPVDWGPVMELSRRLPELSRLTGLFRTDAEGAESLLACEWACMHADHAQSLAAGSTRGGAASGPLAYPLVWDLLCWARQHGARFFDFGGITVGSQESGDPRGGISDFKRSFGPRVVEVGEEWVLEPHWVAARVAAGVARVKAKLTGG